MIDPELAVGEALVYYLDGKMRIVQPGAYVRCAVSGAQIPLKELNYWHVGRQQAYASPREALIGFGYEPERP